MNSLKKIAATKKFPTHFKGVAATYMLTEGQVCIVAANQACLAAMTRRFGVPHIMPKLCQKVRISKP